MKYKWFYHRDNLLMPKKTAKSLLIQNELLP